MVKISKNLAKDNALSGIFEEMAVGSATPILPISYWLGCADPSSSQFGIVCKQPLPSRAASVGF
jgi:hypothetical protein